jgi:hypothetical protein
MGPVIQAPLNSAEDSLAELLHHRFESTPLPEIWRFAVFAMAKFTDAWSLTLTGAHSCAADSRNIIQLGVGAFLAMRIKSVARAFGCGDFLSEHQLQCLLHSRNRWLTNI